MALQASFIKKVFEFNFQARTSRGLMEDKISWFIKIWDDANPSVTGIGECGPLPGLSPDAVDNLESVLQEATENIGRLNPKSFLLGEVPALEPVISADFPSILFAVETALMDLMYGGKRVIFKNSFIEGHPIPINGLIWMGDADFMMTQIDEKIAQGFRCIKLKIGSLDFDRECEILSYVRQKYSALDVTLRVDANGAFSTNEALSKLKVLASYDIHSIEQPIKKGRAEMAQLCADSPVPIAFDEELIGHTTNEGKEDLLRSMRPSFIVLKPTLHGGLSGCSSWIDIATKLGINWWITSALESSIGLNAICQFTANYPIRIPQGLGTGAIYQHNFESPLKVTNGTILLDASQRWQLHDLV